MANVITVTRGVYMLAGVVSRQYLVDTPAGVAVVDTGLAGNHRQILKGLAQIGKSAADVKWIIITHADGDHYGAANALRTAVHADVFASALEADAMIRGSSSRALTPKGLAFIFYSIVKPLFRVQPTPVDALLQAGDTICGMQVISTPGHTPGHISLFIPEKSVLFAGDSIQIHASQPQPSAGANTWDTALARQSFRTQVELQPEHFCCGHGYLHHLR